MNESGFSKWLCGHLKDSGLFAQRLEVTTGAGIPDLAVLSNSYTLGTGDPYDIHPYTLWIELKWKTKHIRPEQYVWGTRAKNVGVDINYVVGYEDRFELYSLDNIQKMTKSYKLTTLIETYEKNKQGVKDVLLDLK
jgi:hypothetical protein